MKLLEEYDISSLFEKFSQAGVTSKVLWDLNDDMLAETGLTKIETLSFLKAKKIYNEKNAKIPGKIVF